MAKGKAYCKVCKKERRGAIVRLLLGGSGDMANGEPPALGAGHNGVRFPDPRLWCEEEDVCLGVLGYIDRVTAQKKVPARVRCPKCKKRFKPYIRECHDTGCLHWYLPRHKVKCVPRGEWGNFFQS